VEGPQAYPPRQHDEGVSLAASRMASPGLNFTDPFLNGDVTKS